MNDFEITEQLSSLEGAGRREGRWSRFLDLLHDPHGLLGFALVGGVLVSYLTRDPWGRNYLFSESLPLEILGHVWLLLGPPAGVALAIRHIRLEGATLLPFITVALGGFLTLAGFGGLIAGLCLMVLG